MVLFRRVRIIVSHNCCVGHCPYLEYNSHILQTISFLFPLFLLLFLFFLEGGVVVGRGLFIERSRKRGVTQYKPNENNAT